MEKIEYIAECGKNQISSPDLSVSECLENAKKLALEAKNAGANVIKWQIHTFEDEQKKRSEVRYDWIKLNEKLTPFDEFWKPLKQYHDNLGVELLVTPMSKMAAEKINPLVKRWKIGSADIVDMELLEYLKSTEKPIILSSGMSTEEQLEKAVSFLGDQIQYLLHCVSEYPAPEENINLYTIKYFKEKYPNIKIGFSDHTLSTDIPVYAVLCGAELIEKHFTIDRNAYGPDHKCSLLPNEFTEMTSKVNKLEKILGKKEKTLTEAEKTYWKNFRV